MTSQAKSWISRAGFVVGLVLAAAVVAAGQVPHGGLALSAQLKVSATASGGLAVSPEGRVLATRRLAPGARPARGRVSLSNQTSSPILVLVRAVSTERGLDRSVRIRLQASDGRSLQARLGALRRWQQLQPALAPHRRERVAVRAWIPASAGRSHRGRRADVTLEFLRKGTRT
jgi:hypothetical protein